MMLRSMRLLLLAGVLGSVSFDATVAQAGELPKSNTTRNRLERVLQAAAAGEKLESDAADHIADLIAIVERGETQEAELAVRALARLGPRASPAIEAIAKKLGDPSHATRSAAVDALVAIGDPCVGAVRKLLDSPTARTRASATEVLSRLKSLDLNDLAKLAEDAEPRVRAAVANALSTFCKGGVPSLV